MVSLTYATIGGIDSLLDSVVKNLLLLRPWGEHSVKCETILLRPRGLRSRTKVNCSEVIIEGDHDLPALPLFDGVRRTETTVLRLEHLCHATIVSWYPPTDDLDVRGHRVYSLLLNGTRLQDGRILAENVTG